MQNAKGSHIFPTKQNRVFVIFVIKLTNNNVNFEQAAPDRDFHINSNGLQFYECYEIYLFRLLLVECTVFTSYEKA